MTDPRGGTVDRIKQQLDTITELTDDQIVELQSSIVSEFESVEGEDPSPQTVETMTTLADMLDTVRAESKRRTALASELAARAAEATTRVKGEAADIIAEDEKAEDADAEKAPESTEMIPDATEAGTSSPSLGDAVDEEKMPAEIIAEEAPGEEPTDAAAEVPMVEEEDPAKAEEEEMTDGEKAQAAQASITTETASELSVDQSQEVQVTTPTIVAQTEQKSEEPLVAATTEQESAEVTELQAPIDRRPMAQEVVTAPVAITAGADIPGYTAGAPIENMREVAEVMSKRLHTLRRVNGGDGEQHIVASFATKYPEERYLTLDAESNWNKIQAVTGPEALVASGGHSAPFVVKYDIFGLGTTERPVRDSLPSFTADRGGIRFVTPPVLSSYASAVGVWTNAVDTTPAGAVKDALTVTAAAELTAVTDAVTMQLQFGNLMTRAYPELIARHNELALIQHAREAEQYILGKISAGSTAVTSSSLIGVARDFLVQIGRASTAYRSRHRMDPSAPLRVLAPSWVRDAMRADLTLQMPGGENALAVADSEIDGYLSARGVVCSYSLDLDVFGSQSTGAMLEFPDTFVWYMFAEGTFLFLDGGTLDLGIIRDSTLVGTNDYKTFVETFEGVAKVGIESLQVTSTISVNGVAAALRDTTGGAAAAAVEY